MIANMGKCPIDGEDKTDCDCEYYYVQDYLTDPYGNEIRSGFCTHPALMHENEKKDDKK